MRRIAIINQKGGVGKTTTAANLGAALALLGRRVVLVDLDPQANLSLHLGANLATGEPSSYDLLVGDKTLPECLRSTATDRLQLLPAHIDLSGAELELASAFGRETLLRDGIDDWEKQAVETGGLPPADYLILDCPPSLGLLSVNGLAAAHEVIMALQTEFFALQGVSKLVEILDIMRRRINPSLTVAGILPTLYDTRLRLAREVLAEIRRYFPGQVFARPIRTNIKLAEAPSHGTTIFEYAPSSSGALDYMVLAREIMAAEDQDPDLAKRELNVPSVEEAQDLLKAMARPKPKNPAVRPSRGSAAQGRKPENEIAPAIESAPAETPEDSQPSPEGPLDELPPVELQPFAEPPRSESQGNSDSKPCPAPPTDSPQKPADAFNSGNPGASRPSANVHSSPGGDAVSVTTLEPPGTCAESLNEAPAGVATEIPTLSPTKPQTMTPTGPLAKPQREAQPPSLEAQPASPPRPAHQEPPSEQPVSYNFRGGYGASRAQMPTRSRLGALGPAPQQSPCQP